MVTKKELEEAFEYDWQDYLKQLEEKGTPEVVLKMMNLPAMKDTAMITYVLGYKLGRNAIVVE